MTLITLTVPEHWSDRTVRELARRLAEDELPETVGVEIIDGGIAYTVRAAKPETAEV